MTRSLLSALGIAVSIAALTAVTGLSATNQAHLLSDLDAQGANLIVASATATTGAEPVFLPPTAVPMARRMHGVKTVAVVGAVPASVHAYKNDLVPAGQTNGLELRAVAPEYFDLVGAGFAAGNSFGEAGRTLPETVLGSEAARLLGVDSAGDRLWIGGQWYLVTGILNPRPLVGGLDGAVLLGDRWVENTLWPAEEGVADTVEQGHLVSLTLKASSDLLEEVREALDRTVNPARPGSVSVSGESALVRSRASVEGSLSLLVLALAAVALLVGAIGIANTMVVAVIERRGEIGLRRALGARPGHIVRQFLLEGAIISGLGGVAGWLAGAGVVGLSAALSGQPIVLPAYGIVAFPVVAVVVGVLSGLHPALKAARVAPTVALRAG